MEVLRFVIYFSLNKLIIIIIYLQVLAHEQELLKTVQKTLAHLIGPDGRHHGEQVLQVVQHELVAAELRQGFGALHRGTLGQVELQFACQRENLLSVKKYPY